MTDSTEFLTTTPGTRVELRADGTVIFTDPDGTSHTVAPPVLDAERERIVELVADRIVATLGQSVIPSSIPAAIGEWIKKTSEHRSWEWTHVIPMQPPGSGLALWWRFNPDGTINMEMRDTAGWIFWRGTFRPVEGRG
jgi:hypothetical protein